MHARMRGMGEQDGSSAQIYSWMQHNSDAISNNMHRVIGNEFIYCTIS